MNFPGLNNYVVPVRGSNITCYLGVFENNPFEWTYSLWVGEGMYEECVAVDTINMVSDDGVTMDTTPEQIARIAYLLEFGPDKE